MLTVSGLFAGIIAPTLIGLIQWLNFHTLEDDNRTALQGLQKKTDVFKKGHLKKEKMYAMYCDKSFR